MRHTKPPPSGPRRETEAVKAPEVDGERVAANPGASVGSGEPKVILKSVGREPQVVPHPLPEVDSTQTVRMLTLGNHLSRDDPKVDL